MHEINTYSPNRWNTLLIFTLISTIGLIVPLGESLKSFKIAILISLAIGGLLLWIGSKSYKAKILISISDSEIEVKWLKNYIFLPRKNLKIEFKNLESWIFDSFENYRFLKLKLISGETIYFSFKPSKSPNYYEFEKHLTRRINQINALPYAPKIRLAKNWYQTILAKVLLLVLLIATTWLCFDVISNSKFTFKGISAMLLMIANFGLYGFKMYLENWKRKDNF